MKECVFFNEIIFFILYVDPPIILNLCLIIVDSNVERMKIIIFWKSRSI